MAVPDNAVGVENLKGAIDLGKQVLKSLELVNGGAVIAILTFYGNVVKDGSRVPIDPSMLSSGLRWFAGGLVLAVAASCFAYLGQLTEATSAPKVGGVGQATDPRTSKNSETFGIGLRVVAIILAVLSLAAFACGTWSTSGSLRMANADQTRWRVAGHVGPEWTFSRRAVDDMPARRVIATCSSYHAQGHELVAGEDACALAVGGGLVEPLQKLAHPKASAAQLPVIDVVDGDTLSVTAGEGVDRVMQLFKVKRDEVVP
ncbi:MAG: hypothetical protein ACHP7A_01015 [Caulobacterales bacterium]|jgi:hypothetical protein